MRKGFLITFEGPEGGGKSTHIRLLAAYLRAQGKKVLLTREPGGTRLAAGIRRLLLDGTDTISPLAELFLYQADRAQHVRETLLPQLRRGVTVLCDRYTDSTLAYQGFGRKLSMKTIQILNQVATGGLKPDCTVLIDVPVRRGLGLAKKKKSRHDRLERAGTAFHKRVRLGFLQLAKKEPKRFVVIRQQKAISETQALIRKALNGSLRGLR